jgi:hypothetical protein
MITRTELPYLTAILALASAGLLSAANTTGATQARVTASYARIPMSFKCDRSESVGKRRDQYGMLAARRPKC